MEWFYVLDGRKQGPVTFACLKALAAQGQLAPGHLVCNADDPEWRRADSVEGLFATVQRVGTAASSQPREQPRPLPKIAARLPLRRRGAAATRPTASSIQPVKMLVLGCLLAVGYSIIQVGLKNHREQATPPAASEIQFDPSAPINDSEPTATEYPPWAPPARNHENPQLPPDRLSEKLQNIAAANNGNMPRWSSPPANEDEAAERAMIEAEADRVFQLRKQLAEAAGSGQTRDDSSVRLMPVRPGYQAESHDTESRWPRASDVWNRSSTQQTPSQSSRAAPTCSTCRGTGNSGFSCAACKGSGLSTGIGSFACGACGGRRFTTCHRCNGRGQR